MVYHFTMSKNICFYKTEYKIISFTCSSGSFYLGDDVILYSLIYFLRINVENFFNRDLIVQRQPVFLSLAP